MKGKVKVVAADDGTVIRQSRNPKYGFIKVSQVRSSVDKNGFANTVELYALIQGTIETLQAYEYEAGQEIPGKIVIEERTKPWNMLRASKEVKFAGKTSVPCKLGQELIYRRHVYTEVSNAEDVLLQHDNIDEIRDAEKVSGVRVNRKTL
jgi:hypothetical protein